MKKNHSNVNFTYYILWYAGLDVHPPNIQHTGKNVTTVRSC